MKNMKEINRYPMALFLGLFVGLFLSTSSVLADEDDFTIESMEGTWGFSASGTILPPALPADTPAVAVGIMTFYDNGECVITDQLNIGGSAIPPASFRTSSLCSFSVNPNGTGTISVLFPGDIFPTPLSFVIVNDEEEFRFIRTDAGVASGVAKRQGNDDGDDDDDNDDDDDD